MQFPVPITPRLAKQGIALSQTLASSAKDTDGALIRNGVGYPVLVMAVDSSNSAASVLSAASSAITLASAGISSLTVSDTTIIMTAVT